MLFTFRRSPRNGGSPLTAPADPIPKTGITVGIIAMALTPLSLFLENKPGHLNAICQTLADEKIDILTLSIADTLQFGIVRLIVDNPEKAKKALETAGFAVNVREVVAIGVKDAPGGLAQLLSILKPSGVNIGYMYALASRLGEQAVLIFRFDDPVKAEEALGAAGIRSIGPEEIASVK